MLLLTGRTQRKERWAALGAADSEIDHPPTSSRRSSEKEWLLEWSVAAKGKMFKATPNELQLEENHRPAEEDGVFCVWDTIQKGPLQTPPPPPPRRCGTDLFCVRTARPADDVGSMMAAAAAVGMTSKGTTTTRPDDDLNIKKEGIEGHYFHKQSAEEEEKKSLHSKNAVGNLGTENYRLLLPTHHQPHHHHQPRHHHQLHSAAGVLNDAYNNQQTSLDEPAEDDVLLGGDHHHHHHQHCAFVEAHHEQVSQESVVL